MTTELSGAVWRRSSYSGAVNNCVEVAGNLLHIVAVRDSKLPTGPSLMLPRHRWDAFTTEVKAGRFDIR